MSDPFRLSIMKDLIPTKISGAYTSPIPPAGFDPGTADTATLIKHGFHWRRPDANSQPAAKAAWDAHFGRDYASGTWLVPEEVSSPGKTHFRRPRATGSGIAWKGDGNDNLNIMLSTDNGATFGGKYGQEHGCR